MYSVNQGRSGGGAGIQVRFIHPVQLQARFSHQIRQVGLVDIQCAPTAGRAKWKGVRVPEPRSRHGHACTRGCGACLPITAGHLCRCPPLRGSDIVHSPRNVYSVGGLQGFSFFASSPLMSLMAVPAAFLGMIGLYHVTDNIREVCPFLCLIPFDRGKELSIPRFLKLMKPAPPLWLRGQGPCLRKGGWARRRAVARTVAMWALA